MKTATLVAIVLSVGAQSAFAQGVPVVGTARVYATPSATSYPLQSPVAVTLGADLTTVTGSGPEGQTPAVLASYQIAISFDRTRLRFESASGGTASGYTGTPAFTSAADANAAGAVTVTGSQTSTALPTGNVVVARLTFTAIASGSASISANAVSLSTARKPGPFGPAAIPSNGSSATVVLGSGPPPVEQTRFIPVAGSASGLNGSFFRTALQLYNPTAQAIQGRVVFHQSGRTGDTSDPSFLYNIGPHQTAYTSDFVAAIGGSSLGSADLVTSDAFPVALATIYNDGGSQGTAGLGEDVMTSDEALHAGDVAVLMTPPDRAAFRFNVGVRTLDAGASIDVKVRSAQGVVLGTITKAYAATFFDQVPDTQFVGIALTGGESIELSVTAGSVIIYGATTDNKTQDPRMQLARKIP